MHALARILAGVLCLAALAVAHAQMPGEEPPGGDPGTSQEVAIDGDGLVTISSKGKDVRAVLFDLFEQGKKNFVFIPNMRWPLYLVLTGVEFEEALEIVLSVTKLDYTVQNGIYFVDRKKATPPRNPVDPDEQTGSEVEPDQPPVEEGPTGSLTDEDLRKKILTTRMPMADIREVFAEFSRQTDINIIVKESVPELKIDAYLIRTSLKYALDVVCRSAGLKYSFNDRMAVVIEVDGETGG